MQITRTDNNSLQFDGDNVKFTFTLNKVQSTAEQLIVGPAVDSDICRPGEYEYNDITVIAAEQREPLLGKANVFKILLEKLNVGFVGADVKKLDKQVLEFIGQVDFLIVSKDVTKDAIASIVGDLEPKWITILDNTDEEAIKLLTGLTPVAPVNKLKLKSDDIGIEEVVTSCVIITSK
jgi:hypothetical protein